MKKLISKTDFLDYALSVIQQELKDNLTDRWHIPIGFLL